MAQRRRHRQGKWATVPRASTRGSPTPEENRGSHVPRIRYERARHLGIARQLAQPELRLLQSRLPASVIQCLESRTTSRHKTLRRRRDRATEVVRLLRERLANLAAHSDESPLSMRPARRQSDTEPRQSPGTIRSTVPWQPLRQRREHRSRLLKGCLNPLNPKEHRRQSRSWVRRAISG